MHTYVHAPALASDLLSVEQKKVTQGLRMFSEDGGRYMASEKQVSSNFNSSVLNEGRKEQMKQVSN